MSEKITISEPKIFSEDTLEGKKLRNPLYICEVYLPNRKDFISATPGENPVVAVSNANGFVKLYLQERIKNLEFILNPDRQKLMEELEWAKRELTKLG